MAIDMYMENGCMWTTLFAHAISQAVKVGPSFLYTRTVMHNFNQSAVQTFFVAPTIHELETSGAAVFQFDVFDWPCIKNLTAFGHPTSVPFLVI